MIIWGERCLGIDEGLWREVIVSEGECKGGGSEKESSEQPNILGAQLVDRIPIRGLNGLEHAIRDGDALAGEVPTNIIEYASANINWISFCVT